MREVVDIGIGEFKVSAQEGIILSTQALGSCIGVMIFSKKSPVAGLLHIQLPDSSSSKELSGRRPAVFADLAIPLMLKEFAKYDLSSKDLIVKLAGGARVVDTLSGFDIGKRNYLAVKKHLWARRLWPAAEAIGGTVSRTVKVEVGKKDVLILTPGKVESKI